MYAGQITDPTGLVYMSARYYDPAIGRFLELDPMLGKLSNPQTLDRYAYCVNNPLIHTDPTGKWLLEALVGAGAGFAAGALIAIASGQTNQNVIIADAIGGAVTGALVGLTDDPELAENAPEIDSAVETALGIGDAGGANVVGGMTTRALLGEPVFDTEDMASDFVLGAATGGMTKGIDGMFSSDNVASEVGHGSAEPGQMSNAEKLAICGAYTEKSIGEDIFSGEVTSLYNACQQKWFQLD